MSNHFYLAEWDLPEASEFNPCFSEDRHQDAGAGAFALRRARYFKKTEQEWVLASLVRNCDPGIKQMD